MKAGKTLCTSPIFKTKEREEFIDFIEASIIVYGNGLIVRKEALDRLKPYLVSKNMIDLTALLSSKKSNIAIRYADVRSYSPRIDAAILDAEKSGSERLDRVTGKFSMEKQMIALMRGRFDGMFGSPTEAFYLAKFQSETSSDNLAFLTIQGDPTFATAYLGCAKGKWKDSIIPRIAQDLRSDDYIDFIAKSYMDWLPENLRDSYWHHVQMSHKNSFLDSW